MFGYVIPCKMELKIKDYEKVKAYYCGLCRAIKYNFGNMPRITINYDMTFLAIFLDALDSHKNEYIHSNCILHPFKKRNFIVNNSPLEYASFINVILAYHKLLDDIDDDNSFKSKIFSVLLKGYLKKIPTQYIKTKDHIVKKLEKLYSLEKSGNVENLDELSHPFGELTAHSILDYYNDEKYQENLYYLGYNLGKWIYIMDAFDDLEKDLNHNKFNGINAVLNKDNLPYNEFRESVESRINFILTSYARECSEILNSLPIEKNDEILYNIFNYGLLEKMDFVFKKEESTK